MGRVSGVEVENVKNVSQQENSSGRTERRGKNFVNLLNYQTKISARAKKSSIKKERESMGSHVGFFLNNIKINEIFLVNSYNMSQSAPMIKMKLEGNFSL
jgi:hypothetical protein